VTTGGLESMLDLRGASCSSEQRDETESATSQSRGARLISITTDSVDQPCSPHDTRSESREDAGMRNLAYCMQNRRRILTSPCEQFR
jgi:hypothetical protein